MLVYYLLLCICIPPHGTTSGIKKKISEVTTAAQWIMNQWELQQSWSTHRLLDPSGDVWKTQKTLKDKPIHSAVDVLACTAHVSALLQAFLNWFQVSQIYLRATNLSLHWSKEDREATQLKPAVLKTADKMQALWLLSGWLSLQWALL